MQQDLTILSQFYKTWDWIENNRTKTAQIAVGVVIVGLILGYYLWSRGEREIKAGQAVSKVSLTAAVERQSPQERAAAFLKVESTYHGSKAGASALLQAGVALFEAGNYPEAYAQFQRFQRDYSSSPLVAQAALGAASCLDAQGKTDEALQAYKNVVNRFPAANVLPQAKYSAGRIFESQGKLREAYEVYEEVVSLVGLNNSMGSEAGIRGAELERKLRAAAPAVAAPAAPSTPTGPASFSLSTSTNLLSGKTNTP